MTVFDEDRIAQLLRLLPPAPAGWVRAAQELPAARAAVDGLLARAEADAAFKRRLVADLEGAVASAGYEPTPQVIERLRRTLASG
jgi:hypothetical protein